MIQSPQCHAKQKPHPGHDAVAIADAHTGLGQVQLEAPDILSRRRVGGAVEKHSKPLAAVNVAPLRTRTELPRVHVLDHAMTERGDGVRSHGKLLSWVRLTTPRFSGRGSPRRYGRPLNWLPAFRLLPRAAGWSAATLCIGTKEPVDVTRSVVGLLGYS